MIADWWHGLERKDRRTASIAMVFLVAAVPAALLAGNAFPPAIAVLIGLTNLLGGTWTKRKKGWWAMVWTIAVLTPLIGIGYVIWVDSASANIAAVVAAVSNIIVIWIRRRMRDN